MIVEIRTLSELESIIRNNPRVVVNFSGLAWCVPCQQFHPTYLNASEKLTDIIFVGVDVDTAEPELIKDVQSIPTILKFKDGEMVGNLESRRIIPLIQELKNTFYPES